MSWGLPGTNLFVQVLPIGRVVIDNQHSYGGKAVIVCRCYVYRLFFKLGRKPKSGAYSRSALHPDFSLHHLHEFLRNRKP